MQDRNVSLFASYYLHHCMFLIIQCLLVNIYITNVMEIDEEFVLYSYKLNKNLPSHLQ
jgi:hypothetical protein